MLRTALKTNRISKLLPQPDIRHAQRDGQTFYAAVDLIAALTDSRYAATQWEDLKRHESALEQAIESFRLPAADGLETVVEMLPLSGVLQVIQSLSSAKAQRLKSWIAAAAAQRIEEEHDPELAVLRTRELYRRRGYSRRWIDGRVSAVSARHDLAGEWYRRGARQSDEFRALTNELIKATFGMGVEAYRNYKGLGGTRQTLRDHMTDMELALTSLAEATAVTLMRQRNSSGVDSLLRDARDAGEIVSQARQRIESHTGQPVCFPGNHLDSTAPPAKAA